MAEEVGLQRLRPLPSPSAVVEDGEERPRQHRPQFFGESENPPSVGANADVLGAPSELFYPTGERNNGQNTHRMDENARESQDNGEPSIGDRVPSERRRHAKRVDHWRIVREQSIVDENN